MLVNELIRRIHEFELLCQKLTQQTLAGLFKSSFKGRGLVIDQIRRYEMGDNVKDIDWNVTARFRETFVKTFTQESERLIWIVIDVSGSATHGTDAQSKYEAEMVLGAALAYSAIESNDRVGVIFYSDRMEGLIQPARGKAHFWRIAHELVGRKSSGGATDVACALSFLMNTNTKHSLVFLLSDFVANDYPSISMVLAEQHELIAIRVTDETDGKFPAAGWVRLQDAESGLSRWVNTSSPAFRGLYQQHHARLENQFTQVFASSAVRSLSVSVQEKYLEHLISFLQNQG